MTTQQIIWGQINPSPSSGGGSAIAGFILGMNPSWTSTTVIGAGSGTVYIESLAGNISGSPVDITPSSPSASTWYHIYVYSSDGTTSGTPTLEASTTAPVAFATPAGFARSKSGDTSRRYLYSSLTDGSSHFWRFSCGQSGLFLWSGNDLGSAPFRVLAAGAATTATTIDCSGCVPTTSNAVIVFSQNIGLTSIGVTVYFGSADYTVSPTVFAAICPAAQDATAVATASSRIEVPCSSSQVINYICSAANGSVYVDVRGFYLQR